MNSMDKKNQQQMGLASSNYQESISKPSFITDQKNKEKEVFLNGELSTVSHKTNIPGFDK